MSTIADDALGTSRAPGPFAELRRTLRDAGAADDAGRIHAVLIAAVDGLLAQAERQAQAEVRGDPGHGQGLIAATGGGASAEPASDERLREFAASSNGDRWFLCREELSGIAHVVHRANLPSGGAVTPIALGAFLAGGPTSPERLGLLKLIGSLVG